MLATLSSGGQVTGFAIAALVFFGAASVAATQKAWISALTAAGLVVLAITWALVAST